MKWQDLRVQRGRGWVSLLALVFLLTLGSRPSFAEAPPDVETLIKQMKEVFEPSRPSIRKIVITVSAQDGRATRWVAGQVRKELPDGKRTLLVLLQPESVRGNALLIQEQEGKPDAMWVYSPALRRARKIVPVRAYEHFLDSDFTYVDLGFVSLRGTHRFLGEEEKGGQAAYKVETVPEDRWYYSRILTWIAKDSLLPMQRDFYDVAGELWATQIFQEVSVIDGVPTPLRIRMTNVQQQTYTELKMSEVRYDVDVPDTLLDPLRLSEVVEAPFWEAHGLQASGGS